MTLMRTLVKSWKVLSRVTETRTQLDRDGQEGVEMNCVVISADAEVTALYRSPVNCQSQVGPVELHPIDAPMTLKPKHSSSASGPVPISAVLPISNPVSIVVKFFSSSRNRFPDDGRYGTVGGGTTTKPPANQNLWYGLNIGSGFVVLSGADNGGISSNWIRISEVQIIKCIIHTFSVKSPDGPHDVADGDDVGETEVEKLIDTDIVAVGLTFSDEV